MKARPLKTGYRRLYVDLLAEILFVIGRNPEEFKNWVTAVIKTRLVNEARRR